MSADEEKQRLTAALLKPLQIEVCVINRLMAFDVEATNQAMHMRRLLGQLTGSIGAISRIDAGALGDPINLAQAQTDAFDTAGLFLGGGCDTGNQCRHFRGAGKNCFQRFGRAAGSIHASLRLGRWAR